MNLDDILKLKLAMPAPCLEGLAIDAWLNTLELLVHSDGSSRTFRITYFDVVEAHVHRGDITPVRLQRWSETEAYQTEEIVDSGETSVGSLRGRGLELIAFNDPANIAGTLRVADSDVQLRLTWLATWGCYLEFFHRGRFVVAEVSPGDLINSRRRQLERAKSALTLSNEK